MQFLGRRPVDRPAPPGSRGRIAVLFHIRTGRLCGEQPDDIVSIACGDLHGKLSSGRRRKLISQSEDGRLDADQE
jgi:hypothetical protein